MNPIYKFSNLFEWLSKTCVRPYPLPVDKLSISRYTDKISPGRMLYSHPVHRHIESFSHAMAIAHRLVQLDFLDLSTLFTAPMMTMNLLNLKRI